MKKHQIQAIAKIRKLLTDNLHTGRGDGRHRYCLLM